MVNIFTLSVTRHNEGYLKKKKKKYNKAEELA